MAQAKEVERVSSASLLPVVIHILKHNHRRAKNTITTSKYTFLTFLPFTLYELLSPFKRLANFLYLVVGAMQLNTDWSPSGQPKTWGSLFMILTIDLIVLAVDDIARHRADRKCNSQTVSIVSPDAADPDGVIERPATWADVTVGDVVRVHSKEAFPADMVLLRGSNPPGTCWVSTKALDGESDMKLRLAPPHRLVAGMSDMSSELFDISDDEESVRQQTRGGPPPLLASVSDLDQSDLDHHQTVRQATRMATRSKSSAELMASLSWRDLRGELHCEAPNDKVNDFVGELRLDNGAD